MSEDIKIIVARAICASGCDCRGFGGSEKNTCDCYRHFDNLARAADLIDMLGIPAATLSALRSGEMVAVPRELIDNFPELNPSNYDHDAICRLNDWGVELVLAAAKDARHD